MRLLKIVLLYIYNKIKFRFKKVRFPISCYIAKNTVIIGNNKFGRNTFIHGYINSYTYIGNNSHIDGKVGSFCSIASNVKVITGTHPLDWVSTSPAFYSIRGQLPKSFVKENLYDEFVYADNEKLFPIIMGNDVWIGDGVSIIAGVSIGDGAVILANSTVTKNVPPYAIVGGTPSTIIRYRFSEKKIKWLLDFKWWDAGNDWIKKNSFKFNDIDKLAGNNIDE